MVKYTDRKAKRRVCETVAGILSPLLPYMGEEVQDSIKDAIFALGHIDVAGEEGDYQLHLV